MTCFESTDWGENAWMENMTCDWEWKGRINHGWQGVMFWGPWLLCLWERSFSGMTQCERCYVLIYVVLKRFRRDLEALYILLLYRELV